MDVDPGLVGLDHAGVGRWLVGQERIVATDAVDIFEFRGLELVKFPGRIGLVGHGAKVYGIEGGSKACGNGGVRK